MQLESFRIFDFRSIRDSGNIEVAQTTTLLGRNESGKSALLLALRTLNPIEGFQALDPTKNFPRHRRLSECSDNTEVVSSMWKLTAAEQEELGKILPRAAAVTHVTIGRRYGPTRWVRLESIPPLELNEAHVRDKVDRIAAAVKLAAEILDETPKRSLHAAIGRFSESVAAKGKKTEPWAANARNGLAALEHAISKAVVQLNEEQTREILELKVLADEIAGDEERIQKAHDWVIGKIPAFIYLDDYPELDGHQNIAQYLERKSKEQQKEGDIYFEKLCKVAGLDPAQLSQLQGQAKSEERNLIANRASAIVTAEIRRLWKDRQLKVRFNLDGEHFETLISDPTSTFDVEVNFDERSRGFRWFFSFYITFSADTDGGRAENAILLLDEPGLFLHIESQKDLQAHLERDFSNQIICTTHSPFMVPILALDRLRTVNIAEDTGTTVTNNPAGDGRTLAPIRAALGYYYSDSLFIGPNNLIVEGATDWWILEAVSKHFVNAGKAGIPRGLALPPVDGAMKVPHMVSHLTSQRLHVFVLLNDEKHARAVRDELLAGNLIRDDNIIFVSDAITGSKPAEADIDDLLDPFVYETLVRVSYAKELAGKVLHLDSDIPRIVKRFEAAFQEIGLTFHKTRPAGLFYRTMMVDPVSVMTDLSAERFQTLFAIISDRLQNVSAAGREPVH
jgi:AAA domain, putative AbiEii toxin, Type IV TA system